MPPAPLPALPPLRILLVEDTAIVAANLSRTLKGLGVTVLGPYATVAAALAAAQSPEPLDGALLDINLGGKLVYPVAAALAERGVPFIFLTGYSCSVVEEAWRSRPIMEKPFGREDLARLMLRVFVPSAPSPS